MARAPKKEKTEQKEPTRNSLRNQAERFILDKYRDEYHAKAAELFAEKEWEYTRRSTPEEQAARKAQQQKEADERKLQKLLEASPYLREKLAQTVPNHTGELNLEGSLNDTTAVGA